MSAKLHDISMPLDGSTPLWPENPGFRTEPFMSISSGDEANVTKLSMDVHTGTHVDAPRHFIETGATVDVLGLDPFVGRAYVLDTEAAGAIGATMLAEAGIPSDAERLLLRTANSAKPVEPIFDEDFAALAPDGAQWLLDNLELKLVGIDYLSIQRYADPPDVHLSLLGAGVAILEGLRLGEVPTGCYELVCLPLRLMGAEGAPARAILIDSDGAGA
ncbi:MAG: cyclase family protein [Solirubrobacteraceae bacterium]